MHEERATLVLAQPRVGMNATSAGRITLVSNRGPVEHRLLEDGQLSRRRGQGGLVTALEPLAAKSEALWIALAATEGDRMAASNGEMAVHLSEGRCRLRLVDLPRPVYQQHYAVFSNPILWFLQHRLWTHLGKRDLEGRLLQAWREGYVPANRAVAEAVVAATRTQLSPIVMLHDYHLYLVPGYIRAQLPKAAIHHFIHIPWPAPAYWQPLPAPMRQAICAGLAASDVIGFQTRRDARHFLQSCREFLRGAHVDEEGGTLRWWEGHTAHVRSYPISVDVCTLRRLAESVTVKAYRDELAARYSGQTVIVRVDRLDPSKNALIGFEAYDRLLRSRPDLVGRVRFLAFLVPSRTGIPEYQHYSQKVMKAVQAINARHGRGDWVPIDVFCEDNRSQALAGLQIYDVLLVNPVADGMNLVAKEGPIVNQRNGVLVLSREAGAYEQLAEAVIPVWPADVADTAEALARAISMPALERQWRTQRLRSLIEAEDLDRWVHSQLDDLRRLASRSRAVA